MRLSPTRRASSVEPHAGLRVALRAFFNYPVHNFSCNISAFPGTAHRISPPQGSLMPSRTSGPGVTFGEGDMLRCCREIWSKKFLDIRSEFETIRWTLRASAALRSWSQCGSFLVWRGPACVSYGLRISGRLSLGVAFVAYSEAILHILESPFVSVLRRSVAEFVHRWMVTFRESVPEYREAVPCHWCSQEIRHPSARPFGIN
jgi:hypothetical protein